MAGDFFLPRRPRKRRNDVGLTSAQQLYLRLLKSGLTLHDALRLLKIDAHTLRNWSHCRPFVHQALLQVGSRALLP